MRLALDYRVRVGDHTLEAAAFRAQLTTLRSKLAAIGELEGAIAVVLDGQATCTDVSDPIIRLCDQWIRKLPWVLSGDTETVAFRNSEHCFGFVPAGDAVEFSFYLGSETEVEEYVVEPCTVRMDAFAKESIRMTEHLVEVVRIVDASLLTENDECRDLLASLEEGRKAWRDYQLHQRR